MLAQKLYEGRREFAGPWNFAPEEASAITVEELAEKAITRMGRGSYVIRRDASKHEMGMLRLDATKARTALGWKPKLDIDKALDMTFEWYKSYYAEENVRKLTDTQLEGFFG
jgi:CDP-glucose 4,6-dehydratase